MGSISSQKWTSCHWKKCTVTGRHLLSQEEIYCHRKISNVTWIILSCHRITFDVTGKYRKVFLVTKRNFLPQEEMYCHRKNFTVMGRNIVSKEEIYCHRKKFNVTRRIFLSQEEISKYRKAFLVTTNWRNLLS